MGVDKQKIKKLLQLETILISRIHNDIEELLKGKETDSQKLKDSITYQVDDKLDTK